MTDEEEILKKLVVEEKDVLRDLTNLVAKASQIFSVEKPSGRIIFKNFGKLNDSQRICAFLAGKYFAVKLGFVQDSAFSVGAIAKELTRPVTALSGPVKELVKKGFIEKLLTKKYLIAHNRLTEIFDEYLSEKNVKR